MIPTAIRAIKENGSPLPLLLTDEERTFFSVIIPIHEAFLNEKNINNISGSAVDKTAPKRRTKEQIKALILDALSAESVSANELYSRFGYSGNASKTFRSCIDELIAERKIQYAAENKQDSNNVLVRTRY